MPEPIKVYVIDYNRKFLVLQWTDPTTGKRRSQSSRCTNQRAAAIKAQEKEKELNAGEFASDGSIEWRVFLDKLQTEVLSGVAGRTSEKICSVLSVMSEFEKPKTLREVNSQYLSRYVGWLRAKPRTESTIQSHLRHIKAVLRWAVANHFIPTMPAIPATPRASKRKMMKGRPLTDAEFASYCKQIPRKVDAGHEANWLYMAKGLWLSGLRLEESMSLSWDQSTGFHVFFSDTGRPQLRIPDWALCGVSLPSALGSVNGLFILWSTRVFATNSGLTAVDRARATPGLGRV